MLECLIHFWNFIDLSFLWKVLWKVLLFTLLFYLSVTQLMRDRCVIKRLTSQVQIEFYWFVKVDLGDYWESTRPNRVLLIYLKKSTKSSKSTKSTFMLPLQLWHRPPKLPKISKNGHFCFFSYINIVWRADS